MPPLAIFAAAAQVGGSIDEPLLQQGQAQRVELGSDGDVEAAISIEQGGIVSFELQSALENQKHWHPGAVSAGVEHLPRLVVLRLEAFDRRLAEEGGCSAGNVVAKNRARVVERG